MDGRHVGDNAWVRTAGHLRLVSRDQLRPAVGFENWAPDQADLDELRNAEKDLRGNNFTDERGPGPPPDEPETPDVVDGIMQEVPLTLLQPPPIPITSGAPATPLFPEAGPPTLQARYEVGPE